MTLREEILKLAEEAEQRVHFDNYANVKEIIESAIHTGIKLVLSKQVPPGEFQEAYRAMVAELLKELS